jgi:molybdate transport system substrate-binding protein
MSMGTKVAALAALGIAWAAMAAAANAAEITVGPLPADIQETTAISAGLAKAAGAGEAAAALVKFLASPATAPAKRKTGLEPG